MPTSTTTIPRIDEEKPDFIARCMRDETMVDDYPDNERRNAVCQMTWDKRDKPKALSYDGRRIKTRDTLDIVTKEVDDDDRTITSVITTDKVDRDAEVVVTQGLSFDDFNKNPVVLFMHNQMQLVGKALWVKASKGEVRAKTQFAQTPLAEEVFQLIKQGILKGVSIGMDYATMQRRDLTEQDVKGRPDWAGARAVIEKATVLEFSFVSIPANPDALVQAEKSGLVCLTKSYFRDMQPVTVRRSVRGTVKRSAIARPQRVEKVQVQRHSLTVAEISELVHRRINHERGIL